jgi:hypothetical protein
MCEPDANLFLAVERHVTGANSHNIRSLMQAYLGWCKYDTDTNSSKKAVAAVAKAKHDVYAALRKG